MDDPAALEPSELAAKIAKYLPDARRHRLLHVENLKSVLFENAEVILAALARPAPALDEVERYRHVKRGTEYVVIGEAELQMASDHLVDGSALVLYRERVEHTLNEIGLEYG